METSKPMSHVNTCARQRISRILIYGNQVTLLSHYLWGPPPWPACLRCRACFVRPACLALFALLAFNPTHPNLSTLRPILQRLIENKTHTPLSICPGDIIFRRTPPPDVLACCLNFGTTPLLSSTPCIYPTPPLP